MKIKYLDKEIELLYSFRSNIYFEQIQGKNIDFAQFTANDVLVLFYCIFIATLQKNKMPIVSLDDFMDIVDENGGEKCFVNFSSWYIETVKKQYEIMNDMEDEKPKKEKGKKNKN